MVERWTFVGSMIQRLQIVWIYGLKKGKQAKYCELKFSVFRPFQSAVLKKYVAGNDVFWTYNHTTYVLYVFYDQKDYLGTI